MTTAHNTSTCPVLTGPNNFQIWKLKIISKLRQEKVLRVVTGEELKPSPGKPTSSEDPEITWILKDEKAHGIIQDHISDALLMRTGDLTSSKESLIKLSHSIRRPTLPRPSIHSSNSPNCPGMGHHLSRTTLRKSGQLIHTSLE
ncbi:hypothetical protein SERLADRAFT_434574 [Serpula lacrymans var. lacrymans S7.9]|uniref:Retrotransposon Copia-like N-terminal domain-containing protein n=1 Tax=Serpula lacrymans var. lacrymans (strain S7.9) TaxID=578457 RepID=F8NJS4_SERL9|nr:uncharacterized protein SERLADRAFT_434574 [Serpula lacrymans var. lacrymans S7.9]EGO28660.1 hypothetical protein SERLADRAFT_434574 [Serpula lacrymans var. lacrymans S7.9]